MTTDNVQRGDIGAKDAGEVFRPCLIGGKPGTNPTFPDYHDPVALGGGCFASLDMLRLKLHFARDGGERLDVRASTLPVLCQYSGYTAKIKPGGWRSLHQFDFGETSAALGIGWMGKGCKVDMSTGFLEFNPNKLGGNEEFRRLLDLVGGTVKTSRVVRYDLAVDVPTARENVRLQKDGRKYKLELSSTLTEYLGVRNAPGYVKVYDKAGESGLDAPLTRVEMTCDGAWTVADIGERWPNVYRCCVGKDVRGITRVAVQLLGEKVLRGESVEADLKQLDHKTRKRVREYLQSASLVPFPELGAASVLVQAVNWSRSLEGAAPYEVEMGDSRPE